MKRFAAFPYCVPINIAYALLVFDNITTSIAILAYCCFTFCILL